MTRIGHEIAGGRGVYYSFESSDGAGKTTQIELFRKMLEGRRPGGVVEISLPSYDRPLGHFIRTEILPKKVTLDSDITQNLMALDIADVSRRDIQPALSSGKDVIVARGPGSNIAYSVAFGIPASEIEELHRMRMIPEPDITFYLRVSSDIAMDRIEKRGAAKELFEKNDVQARVIEAFEVLSSKPGWVTINGAQPIKKVAEDVARAWKSFLAKHDIRQRYGP